MQTIVNFFKSDNSKYPQDKINDKIKFKNNFLSYCANKKGSKLSKNLKKDLTFLIMMYDFEDTSSAPLFLAKILKNNFSGTIYEGKIKCSQMLKIIDFGIGETVDISDLDENLTFCAECLKDFLNNE